MRPLKFRAWDKTVNKMLFFDGIFNRRLFTERSTFPQYESCPEYHELDIMQYTGLHDCEGKEIWEGDRYRWGLPGEEEAGTIVFIDGCFRCKSDNGREMFDLYSMLTDIIVSGNIYENPSLLEA